MATASQPIEQPMLPAAAGADSLAGVGPATSAAEKISLETPRDSCELGSIEPSLTDAEQKAAVDGFLKLDAEVYTKTDELTDEFQDLMGRFNDELLPIVDRMQGFLSQRGNMRGVIPGLPSWTSWRDAFLNNLQKKMKMSLSTLKRRLKEFRQLDEPEESEGEETDEEGGEEEEDEPVIYDSPKEQVTKWVERQRKVLSGGDGPMDADPIRDGERRVDTSLQMLDELTLALDEGLLDGIEAASVPIPAMPMRPEITGEPVAEPDPDTLEGFRHQLFRIPDTRDMEKEVPLKAYLNRLAAQLMEGHPLTPVCGVQIRFYRPNGCGEWDTSICIGDWLEYRGGNLRLTKQLGGNEIALGRVVGSDMLKRPCVRWFNGREWIKPYSLFQEGRQVNVLFDYRAAEAYPDAFNSYPKEKEKIARHALTNKSNDTVEDDPLDDDIPAVSHTVTRH